jgi:flagellar M-ring protein FliF
MANAEAANPFSLDLLGRLTVRQLIVLMVAISLVIAVLAGSWMWLKQSDYSVLFSNLAEKDGGEVIAALQQQNIPFQFSEGGGAILVPSNVVHETRLRLASQGLPKGGMVGFELMENQKMGASQFLEQVNYQRALEGELAKTISTLSSVRGARVHLAIPKQSAFLRDELKPTASVVVGLLSGRALEPSQIAGIVHLVSASVPELTPSNVSVIDQDGNLLSQAADGSRNIGLDASQLHYVREIETSYNKRIEAILSPIVGVGNVHAQVSADIDFSQSDQVAETYKPNPPPGSAIRSQQTSENNSSSPGPSGVPGALTNQPAPAATAPITGSGATTTSTAGGGGQNLSKSSTINYEVDKTIRHTKEMPGVIRRLSVAVVVNQKRDASKPNAKPAPLSDKEMAQATELVREAMGYNKERGDSLNVTNALFNTAGADAVADTPLWKDPSLIGSAKGLLKYVLFGVIAFLLWTRLLKPLFANLTAMAQQRNAANSANSPLVVDDDGSSIATSPGRAGFESKMKSARQMASNDPKLVANLIKEWVSGNGSR